MEGWPLGQRGWGHPRGRHGAGSRCLPVLRAWVREDPPWMWALLPK